MAGGISMYMVFINLLACVLSLPTANHTCQHDKYACGDGACIPVNWVCDGEVDCKNDMDEQNCDHPTTCSGGSYQCSSGACVPHRWRCDGELDCNDGSDEENCTSTVSVTATKSTTSTMTSSISSVPPLTSTMPISSSTISLLGPDPNCRDEQLNCHVLVTDIDICSMPASAQLLCASTCRMCSGSSGSQNHVTDHQTTKHNPGHPTASTQTMTTSTPTTKTTTGTSHSPYTAPSTNVPAASGCVDAEDNCEHLVKTINICSDPVKAEFICQRTCNACGTTDNLIIG